jgi:hypothetical protein
VEDRLKFVQLAALLPSLFLSVLKALSRVTSRAFIKVAVLKTQIKVREFGINVSHFNRRSFGLGNFEEA